MTELITPRTPDLKPRPSRCFRFLDGYLYSTLSLLTNVYKLNGYRQHTAGGVTLRWTSIPIPSGGVAIFLGMLHAKETWISWSGRFDL